MLEKYCAKFARKRIGLVLIASPSAGSHLADWAGLLAKVYGQKLGLQLKRQSEALEDLDRRFKDLVHNPERGFALTGIEGFENHFVVHRKWLPDKIKVVTAESAGRYFGAPVHLRGTDHFTAVKPSRTDHPAHELLIDFLAKFREQQAGTGDDARPVHEWISAAKAARDAKLIHHTRPLPTSLMSARAAFESWWAATTLDRKIALEPQILEEALSLTARLYRMQELQSESKPTAFHWADEAIRYFEQASRPRELVEALLDKAAIYLELSQIEHTDREMFRRVAQDGDAVMSRAATLAKPEQLPALYRIWSRFFQNIARPGSGRLSDRWDNTHLFAAYEKIKKAVELDPLDIKNITQFARIADRLALNPPQTNDPAWTKVLREAQETLLARLKANDAELKTPAQRIPPLNILAVITLDIVRREWLDACGSRETQKAPALAGELDDVACKAMREAITLLPHTEWKKEYDFDFHYDLARILGLKSAIVDSFSGTQGEDVFEEARLNMMKAREGATTAQLDAALDSLTTDPNLVLLTADRRLAMTNVLRGASR